MVDVRAKYVPPAIDQLAFNCPHCGALAKQFWLTLHAAAMKKDGTPLRLTDDEVKDMTLDHIEEADERRRLRDWAERMAKGRPFIERNSKYREFDLQNVSLSRCYNCNDVALWIYDRLIWPQRGEAPLPNPDLPDDVQRDYGEASTIFDLSPRGAAALLRLGIQKLCAHLGENGKSIDDDIASLVRKGLDVRVQQALDVVRVIGNNAVHPGQIDLRDDRATAKKLFGLVNLIAEIMISQPKHVAEMYSGLPESSRKAIEIRDKKR
ncbi:MAG: DUF4145 domain-containing protein [Alphaproteobacteria bacterium]